MLVLFCLVSIMILPLKSKCRLEAENVALRHQVMVLRCQLGGRVYLTNLDRLFLVQLHPSAVKMDGLPSLFLGCPRGTTMRSDKTQVGVATRRARCRAPKILNRNQFRHGGLLRQGNAYRSRKRGRDEHKYCFPPPVCTENLNALYQK